MLLPADPRRLTGGALPGSPDPIVKDAGPRPGTAPGPRVAVKGGDDPAHPAAIRFDVRVCADWEIEAIGRRLHEIFGS